MQGTLSRIFIVCLGVFVSCLFAQAAEAGARGETSLTVATFNIDAKSNPDIALQRKLLADRGVEVAGLQEVDCYTARNPIDMPSLFRQNPFKEAYFAKAIDFEGGQYGICLVSAHRLLEKKTGLLDSAGAEEQRVYERALIEKDGKKIAVYNTHLSWETEKIRNKQLNELKAIVDADPTPYKIIMGDLNVDQHHRELDMFKASYRLSNGKDGAWYDTFNGVDPAMKVMSVDNIITSKNIEIRGVKMVETTLSDHHMLLANLLLLEE